MIEERRLLTGEISSRKTIYGDLNKQVEVVAPSTQAKTVTPTKEIQEVIPDKGVFALSKVTVKEIPDEYIIAKLDKKIITQNGVYTASDDNLSGYSEVEVLTGGVDINDYYVLTKKSSGDADSYIKSIPQIDTSDYTSFRSFFVGFISLESIPLLNASKVTDLTYFADNSFKLSEIKGFLNLGQAYDINVSENNRANSLILSASSYITKESIMNIFSNLYDIKSKGCKSQYIRFNGTVKSLITDEDVAIATEKGWSVT